MSVVSTVDINETCQFTEDTGLLQPPNNISTATTAIDNAPVQHDDTEDPQQQVPGSLEESPVAAISQRSLRTVVTIQAFMLLWLVPVVALLVLNFQGSIIGASAWCFRGDCNVDHFSATRNRHEEEQYSHDSRNLVGVLQVVAKALEVWFVFITFSLVFLATMSLAEHSRGLPNGYLTRAYQYADLSSLFERSLWKSFPLGRQKHDLHIQGYIICTILLCLLCTLMGPATAVMAIPTLQWRNTETTVHGVFKGLTAWSPPTKTTYLGSTLPYCHSLDYKHARFSCSQNYRGWALDGWLGSVMHISGGNTHILSEQWVAFALNGSVTGAHGVSNKTVWVPNRNFLWRYSNMDFRATKAVLAGAQYNLEALGGLVHLLTKTQYDSYAVYNESLQVEVLRQGPIVGTNIALWYTNAVVRRSITTAKLDHNRSIRCYEKYQFAITYRPAHEQDLYYTKCIQIGKGWGNSTNSARFYLNATSQAALGDPNITANVFSSDRVAYLPHGILPPAVPESCINNGQVPSGVDCSVLFAHSADTTIANRTRYVTTMELSIKPPSKKRCTLTIDHVAYLGFTNYSLDLSAITNPTYQVQTLNTPLLGQPQPVHPFWTLAAWSVDDDGYLANDRTVAVLLFDLMLSWANGNKTNPAPMRTGISEQVALTSIVFVPIFQTISMLGFYAHNTTSASDDPAHILSRYARRYVWSYGMYSTSARLSAAVMIGGVIVVVIQFILGLIDRRHSMNMTEMFKSALAHQPGLEAIDEPDNTDRVALDWIRILPSHSAGSHVEFAAIQR